MVVIKEKLCKSILSKSGITEYCINCYTGCYHACVYCYARFMCKFTNHHEPWGEFVDVKINAPEVLIKEIKKKKTGEVFISSVCDGWQPLEEKYQLTRQCLRLLIEFGYSINVLTKSALIVRDFDILKGYNKATVGFTVTTLDETIRKKIEPRSSPALDRIRALEKANALGIKTYLFLGPFLPYISDTEKNLSELIKTVSTLPLNYLYIDKLNIRSGVYQSIISFLKTHYKNSPELISYYRRFFFDEDTYLEYSMRLRRLINQLLNTYKLNTEFIFCF